jgi:serine/threonine-protein kinase
MKPSDPSEDPDTLVRSQEAAREPSAPRPGDDATSALEGYVFGEVIGSGGVGEVVLAHDLRVGRDVAIKRLHSRKPTSEETARFLREARIQARLDHPAVPPVYELGTDPQGRPFFTMKRLAGTTFSEMLKAPEPNRQRLLRAFADVCFAIDFAHSRGVVHRDLKPSNIMLGGFGDVYVLDWGLSRVVGEAVAEVVSDDIDSLDVDPGGLLGTPGYMSPEQLQKAAEAGRPADVYALGAILFETLAGEPLHPRGPTALQSTVSGEAITSPAKRRTDRQIAPELDAICTVMLAMDPAARPTARRVAERVEAYLDGDRDVARRRTMAIDLVWSSRAAFNEGRRAEAMSAGGRALALDPESAEAAELVTRLMLEPPTEPPVELRAALEHHDEDAVRRHARQAIAAYLALASFFPIAIWNGIRRWDVVFGVFVIAMTLATAAWRIHRKPVRSLAEMVVYALGNVVLIGVMTRMVGPFTFVPALTCVVIMSVMAYPIFIARSWLLIALIAVGFLLPIVLELVGVLSSTWEIRGGQLISHAGALAIEGTPTLALLIFASLATIVVAGILAARIYRIGRDARRQLAMQAWHLRQLLPTTRLPRAASLSGI